MPFVDINLRSTAPSASRKPEVSEAIHRAMVDVLEIPEDDLFHTYHEVAPDSIVQAPTFVGIPRGEGSMFITLSFNDRDPEQKARLFDAVVSNLEKVDVPRADVFLRIIETGRENWWAEGRVVDPSTGYDERMSGAPTA